MNIWDWGILATVAAGTVLAALHIRKNRKNGKCPGGCEGCGGACGNRPGNGRKG